ncbi:MAG TPA: DUF6602 domain-containing protein [Kofleriaceae bacterium]|nr:DUF6602 domain-containing protein [Kofleriaceae bacterium]
MAKADDDSLAGLLRKRMLAQADMFAAITSHPTLIGSGREDALAELLRQLLPRRLELLSGTIAIFNAEGVPEKSTHQIDLIVADTLDYPTLLRVGGTAVVLPPAVRALIEVKSDLAKGADFVHAVAQICRIKQMLGLGEPVFTTLFSFAAPSLASTLRGWLEELMMLRRSLSGENVPEVNNLREEVLGDERKAPHAAAELLAVLSADNLPDMVVADRGAVARKTKELDPLRDFYSFLKDRDDTPAVAVFIDQLLQYLSATAERTVAFPGAGSHKLAMELVRAQFGVKLEAFDGDRIEIPQLGPSVSS